MTTDATGAAPAESAPPVDIFGLVGTVLDRKFRVERLVAEGGFGVVYFGTHLTLEKPIAIKVLKTPAEFNEKARAQFIEKFALEGKTMARISHPNIVQVLDFGASQMPSGDLAPWMVLEWLTGNTLESLLQTRRGNQRFTPDEALHVMRPVLEALAYAHDEGIAHRDIKPANMMVVQSKRGSTLRLMDFGIAKLMEDGESAGSGATRTRTTMNAFSPQYAAPEQISGTRTGPWTDVHALGLIITEMLTDQSPYDGDDMTSLFGQILSPLRPTPSRRGVDVGPLEPILARSLAMKPDERFKNAGEFLAALDAVVPNLRAGVLTGAFPAINNASVAPGSQTSPSPTTLRGQAVQTQVPTEAPKSKLPIVLGLGALVLVGAIGATVALSHHGSEPTAAARSIPTAPPVQANTAGGQRPVAPVVAPVQPVAPPPVAPTPVAPTPTPTTNVAANPAGNTSGTQANGSNGSGGATQNAHANNAGNGHANGGAAHPAGGHPAGGQHPAGHAGGGHPAHQQQIELE